MDFSNSRSKPPNPSIPDLKGVQLNPTTSLVLVLNLALNLNLNLVLVLALRGAAAPVLVLALAHPPNHSITAPL